MSLKFEEFLPRRSDQADLARLGQVTQARMSQIMSLMNLAPDIQEAILLKVQVLVYMIKSKTRHKVQKQKRARITASFKHANAIELITGIRKIAKDAGGMENLKKFVDALTE